MTGAERCSAKTPVIHVAAGCLINARGEVLIAQRPQGKIAAGKWEFPGGKIEAGETARQALERELREELGIAVSQARPLIRVPHEYSDRRVLLDTWLIPRFTGAPHPHDGQALAWVSPDELPAWDLLAADGPIVSALRLPNDYVFTPPDADTERILRGLGRLPRGALLRLRWPGLSEAAYEARAAKVLPAARSAGLRVVLDRSAAMAARLGADGWHATAQSLSRSELQLAPELRLSFASCHDLAELRRARELGCAAAVLGPVRATNTHPDRMPIGWDRFEELASSSGLPVYAIGGVGPAQRETAFSHYAQGTAGITAYW